MAEATLAGMVVHPTPAPPPSQPIKNPGQNKPNSAGKGAEKNRNVQTQCPKLARVWGSHPNSVGHLLCDLQQVT